METLSRIGTWFWDTTMRGLGVERNTLELQKFMASDTVEAIARLLITGALLFYILGAKKAAERVIYWTLAAYIVALLFSVA